MAQHKSTERPDAIDAYVGARVKSRRIQLKMSQAELGYLTGVSFQQIQKYENGRNRISSSRLSKIGNAMAVPPAYFFLDPLADAPAGHDVELDDLAGFVASREGVDLMQAFVRIKSKKLRRMIAELAADLATRA
jgi:transcriptional regulator with XRE-family HTH domain